MSTHQGASSQAGGLNILQQLGKWAVCEDEKGLFYYDTVAKKFQMAAPEELKAMGRGCRRTAEEVLDILGDWAVCEDAEGVFFMHTRTKHTQEQPPPGIERLDDTAEDE